MLCSFQILPHYSKFSGYLQPHTNVHINITEIFLFYFLWLLVRRHKYTRSHTTTFDRQQAETRRHNEVDLRNKLRRLQSDFQNNRSDMSIQGELEQCSKHVEKYEDGKTSRHRLKAKVYWRGYGDSCKKTILGQ